MVKMISQIQKLALKALSKQ